jgi:cytochrome c biogenesis factor
LCFLNGVLITKLVYLYIMYDFFIQVCNFNIFDNFSKLCINDTLLNIYILSSSSLTIWFLFYLLYFIFFKIYKNINTLFLIIYFFISFYFFIYNQVLSFVTFWLMMQNVNTTLQNGLVNIHPVYIYVIYIYIYIIWFYNYKFYNSFIFKFVNTSILFSMLCVIISGIYLGAFWASQELNWGGFWSWDPVELVSLFLLFWFIFTFHNKNNNIINKPVNHILITGVVIYFIIRLGIVTTIHSFIKTNSKPFFSKIFIVMLFFCIYLNKKKYYYIYNYFTNINIVVLFVICCYLCTYIVSLIDLNNIPFLNPIYFYFLVVVSTISTYITSIKNKIEFYKYFVKTLLFFIFFCLVKVNITIMFLILVFVYNLYVFKKIQLHTTLLTVYFLFFLFFININIYNNNIINLYNINININILSNSLLIDSYHEIFFFLKKNMFFIKLKNLIMHIAGFSITTNNASSLFLFSKNNNIYFIFTLEIIYIIVYYLIVLCIFILTNYKYLDYKHNYKIFKIKNY